MASFNNDWQYPNDYSVAFEMEQAESRIHYIEYQIGVYERKCEFVQAGKMTLKDALTPVQTKAGTRIWVEPQDQLSYWRGRLDSANESFEKKFGSVKPEDLPV